MLVLGLVLVVLVVLVLLVEPCSSRCFLLASPDSRRQLQLPADCPPCYLPRPCAPDITIGGHEFVDKEGEKHWRGGNKMGRVQVELRVQAHLNIQHPTNAADILLPLPHGCTNRSAGVRSRSAGPKSSYGPVPVQREAAARRGLHGSCDATL